MEFTQTEKFEKTIEAGIRYLSPFIKVKQRKEACQVWYNLRCLDSNEVIKEILKNSPPIERLWGYYEKKLKKSLSLFTYDIETGEVLIDNKFYVDIKKLPTIGECSISLNDCKLRICTSREEHWDGFGEVIKVGGYVSYSDIANSIAENIYSLKEDIKSLLEVDLDGSIPIESENDKERAVVQDKQEEEFYNADYRFPPTYNEIQIRKLHYLLVDDNFLEENLEALLYYCGIKDIPPDINRKLRWVSTAASLAYFIDKMYSKYFGERFPETITKNIFVLNNKGISKECKNLKQSLRQANDRKAEQGDKRNSIYEKLDKIIKKINEATS